MNIGFWKFFLLAIIVVAISIIEGRKHNDQSDDISQDIIENSYKSFKPKIIPPDLYSNLTHLLYQKYSWKTTVAPNTTGGGIPPPPGGIPPPPGGDTPSLPGGDFPFFTGFAAIPTGFDQYGNGNFGYGYPSEQSDQQSEVNPRPPPVQIAPVIIYRRPPTPYRQPPPNIYNGWPSQFGFNPQYGYPF